MFNLSHINIPKDVASQILKNEYVSIYILKDTFFNPIENICMDIIKDSFEINNLKLPQTKEKVLKVLSKTNKFSIYKNLDKFCILENAIKNIFKDSNIRNFVKFCEFPMNTRVVQSKEPTNYLEGKYPTDNFHSDIWGGEPRDTLHGFFYIGGDIEKIYLKLFEITKENKKYIQTTATSDYKKMSELEKYFQELKYTPQKSMMILFNSIVPHKTFRSGSDVRISLDFRFKADTPSLKQISTKAERNRMDKYYKWDDKHFNTYKEKLTFELNQDYQSFWYKQRILELIK